jgi:hypothetical protein
MDLIEEAMKGFPALELGVMSIPRPREKWQLS